VTPGSPLSHPATVINPFSAALEADARFRLRNGDSERNATVPSRVQQLESLLACPREAMPNPRLEFSASPAFSMPAPPAAAALPPADDSMAADGRSNEVDEEVDPAQVLFGFLSQSLSTCTVPASTAQNRGAFSSQHAEVALRTERVLRYSPLELAGSRDSASALQLPSLTAASATLGSRSTPTAP
jgi:hypothetical protein